MPTSVKFKAPFCPGSAYHVIFRSIDGLLLFQVTNDYKLFLEQFANYLHPLAEVFAYNLLPNHAHFILQIKERESLVENLVPLPPKFRTGAMGKFLKEPANYGFVDVMVERQMNSFMTSYVRIRNFREERKGGLFRKPFRRSIITTEAYLQQAIIYVHANAQKHGIVKNFTQYPYTSYHDILSGNSANVQVEKSIDFFGGRNLFIELHRGQADHFYPAEVGELLNKEVV